MPITEKIIIDRYNFLIQEKKEKINDLEKERFGIFSDKKTYGRNLDNDIFFNGLLEKVDNKLKLEKIDLIILEEMLNFYEANKYRMGLGLGF